MQKQELIKLLDEKFDKVTQWLEQQPDHEFTTQKVTDKWSNGEHLEHLRKTTRAINKGMKLPKLFLRYKFGKMNRPERTYDQVVTKYQKALKKPGVKSPKEFIADNISNEDKGRILSWFQEEKTAMQNIINKHSEKALTKYIIPHPLIGRMSFREFVLFTAYHTEHHFLLMKKYNS